MQTLTFTRRLSLLPELLAQDGGAVKDRAFARPAFAGAKRPLPRRRSARTSIRKGTATYSFVGQVLKLCLALALLGIAAPASAHPHVFIEMNTSLAFTDDGRVSGLGVIWVFDGQYTEAALDGLDANGDGAYSDTEIEPLTKENMLSLKDYDYFTAIRFDGKKQAFGEVTRFKQIYANGRLALQFFVPLAEPVDPRKGRFSAKVYDPEFFIGIDYAATEPFRVAGVPAEGCAPKLLPLPTDEELEKQREFLASKGKDWKPEVEEDFGETFAQALVVECAGS